MADPTAIQTWDLNLWYGTFQALFDVNLEIPRGKITSLIGPSGCGKTTFLRSVNRINERLGYVRTTGRIEVHGQDVYAPEVELAVYDERGMESIRNFGLRMYMEDPLTTANLGKIFVR